MVEIEKPRLLKLKLQIDSQQQQQQQPTTNNNNNNNNNQQPTTIKFGTRS
jgi:hypothetical protein